MASFEDLPVELKEAIILETPLRDVSSLSKTCKAIRAVALPVMFRKIDFVWDANKPDGPAITALLRSILENLHIGRHIKELNLKTVNYRGFQAPGFNGDILLPGHTHRIPAPDWAMFEKALEACPCEEKGECDDPTTREGNLNAGIAVLISHCMRVESLRMDIELLMHNYRFPAMLRSTLYRSLGPWGKQSWFEKLTEVTVSHTIDPNETVPHYVEQKYASSLPVPLDTFLKLFYFPAVRTLDLMFFPNVDFSEGIQKDTLRHTVWPFPQAPIALYLTALQLRRSSALPATLGLLLTTTPSLTALEYDLLIPASKAPVYLDTLRQALERVRRSLKHLSIRWEIFRDHHDYFGDREPDIADELTVVCVGALGSLRDFQALLTLETSLAVLYGQEREVDVPTLAGLLPPNLQRLVIVDDLWDFIVFYWNDLDLLEMLRRFLAGQKKRKEWFDEKNMSYEVSWMADAEPEWRTATPHLSELILDFEARGWMNTEYLHRAEQQLLLRRLCEEQGIKGEVKHQRHSDDHSPENLTL